MRLGLAALALIGCGVTPKTAADARAIACSDEGYSALSGSCEVVVDAAPVGQARDKALRACKDLIDVQDATCGGRK